MIDAMLRASPPSEDDMQRRLSGKVAIVTGSGRGIGKAVALRLAREGADVVVADIDEKEAGKTAAEIETLQCRSLAVRVDLARVAEIQNLVDAALGRFHRIDILVNNAGVAQTKPLLEITREDWDRVMDINLRGLFFCMQKVGAQMIGQIPEEVLKKGRADRSYGKIVNLSSIAGRRGRDVQPHYAASKAAIISVTQSAALAFAPYNINVNAIAPSIVLTPMWQQVDRERSRLTGVEPGSATDSYIQRIPLQRPGTPEDMASAIAFLCSEEADYITGQTLNVDGGFEMD